jgi:hypothetical protein
MDAIPGELFQSLVSPSVADELHHQNAVVGLWDICSFLVLSDEPQVSVELLARLGHLCDLFW